MSWYQLIDILKLSQEEFDFYADQPPMSCPNDGEPLTLTPLSASGEEPAPGATLFCRFDGWQYPRDYVRPQRHG